MARRTMIVLLLVGGARRVPYPLGTRYHQRLQVPGNDTLNGDVGSSLAASDFFL